MAPNFQEDILLPSVTEIPIKCHRPASPSPWMLGQPRELLDRMPRRVYSPLLSPCIQHHPRLRMTSPGCSPAAMSNANPWTLPNFCCDPGSLALNTVTSQLRSPVSPQLTLRKHATTIYYLIEQEKQVPLSKVTQRLQWFIICHNHFEFSFPHLGFTLIPPIPPKKKHKTSPNRRKNAWINIYIYIHINFQVFIFMDQHSKSPYVSIRFNAHPMTTGGRFEVAPGISASKSETWRFFKRGAQMKNDARAIAMDDKDGIHTCICIYNYIYK